MSPLARTLTTTAATVSALDDEEDDERSLLIRKQTTNDALRREATRSSIDEDLPPPPLPERKFNFLIGLLVFSLFVVFIPAGVLALLVAGAVFYLQK